MPEVEMFHNVKCEPEVAVSYRCNLDVCTYCYARCQRMDDEMSVEAFGELIGWFRQVLPSFKGLTLLGGEPTAIPNLGDYLKAAESRNALVSFFTNGSFVERIAKMLCESSVVRTFYFHLEPLHFELFSGHEGAFTRNVADLSGAGKDVRLRVNFHGNGFDYELPLRIASEYSLPIAWSITSPCSSMNDYVRRKDLVVVGERLGEFFRRAKGLGLSLNLLRPIPRCAFPDGVFEEFRGYSDLGRHCNVSTYVHPNLQVQFCTVLDGTRTPPIKSAEELRAAILKFQAVDAGFRGLSSFNTCPSCNNYKTLQCQGGCLSYKVFGDHT